MAVNIAASLEQLCTDWEIPTDCVKCVVMDNGHNIQAAARRLPWLQQALFHAHLAAGGHRCDVMYSGDHQTLQECDSNCRTLQA